MAQPFRSKSRQAKTAEKQPSSSSAALGRVGLLVYVILTTLVLVLVGRWFDQNRDVTWKARDGLIEIGRKKSPPKEIPLCENMQCENSITLRQLDVVKVSVYALPDKGGETVLKDRVAEHQQEIEDRIRTIVSSAEYHEFVDPCLKAVTNKIDTAVSEVLGKGSFRKIVIPVWNVVRKQPEKQLFDFLDRVRSV